MAAHAADHAALLERALIVGVHFKANGGPLRFVFDGEIFEVDVEVVAHVEDGGVGHGDQHEAVAERVAVENVGIGFGDDADDVVFFDGVDGLLAAGAAGEVRAADDDVGVCRFAALAKGGVGAVEGVFGEEFAVGALLEERRRDDVVRVDVVAVDRGDFSGDHLGSPVMRCRVGYIIHELGANIILSVRVGWGGVYNKGRRGEGAKRVHEGHEGKRTRRGAKERHKKRGGG